MIIFFCDRAAVSTQVKDYIQVLGGVRWCKQVL